MKNPQSMSDDEIAAELKGLRHTGGYLDAGSTGAAEALRFIADRVRTLLDEQDDRVPDEPPGEEMGKILTAFAGTVVTISIQCACCNERLIANARSDLPAALARIAELERVVGLAHRFVCAMAGAKLRKSDFDTFAPLVTALNNLSIQEMGRCLDACAPVTPTPPERQPK